MIPKVPEVILVPIAQQYNTTVDTGHLGERDYQWGARSMVAKLTNCRNTLIEKYPKTLSFIKSLSGIGGRVQSPTRETKSGQEVVNGTDTRLYRVNGLG